MEEKRFCNKKTLQVTVKVGEGCQQFLIDKDICVSPPSPPVYGVKDIKKWIEVYESKVIPGKVIFNAYLWKDINYTTVEHVHDETVNGPVYHSTTKIPFSGFVEIKPCDCNAIKEGDKALLVCAEVEGSKDIWHDESCVEGEKVYKKLHEKTVVKLTFEVVRSEEVRVEVEPPCPKPPEPPCDCDK